VYIPFVRSVTVRTIQPEGEGVGADVGDNDDGFCVGVSVGSGVGGGVSSHWVQLTVKD